MPGQRAQAVPPARHDHERPPPEEAEGPGGGRHAGPASPGHGRHRRPTGTAPDKNSPFSLFCDVTRPMVFHILDSFGFYSLQGNRIFSRTSIVKNAPPPLHEQKL